MGLPKKRSQVKKPRGWEGSASANIPNVARHSTSGHKPFFLTGKSALLLIAICLATFVNATGRILDEYEGRTIASIEITFEGSPSDPSAEAEFLSIIRLIPNTQFSAVAVRDSLQALFDSERVASARVEVYDTGSSNTGPIRLRFVIQRQVQIGDVKFEIAAPTGIPVTQDELRARLNLSQPGTRLSKQIISRNADDI